MQSGAWKQMGAQPCSTPMGVNVAFEDQKHLAGIDYYRLCAPGLLTSHLMGLIKLIMQ